MGKLIFALLVLVVGLGLYGAIRRRANLLPEGLGQLVPLPSVVERLAERAWHAVTAGIATTRSIVVASTPAGCCRGRRAPSRRAFPASSPSETYAPVR